jgi:hypothetical protein
MHHPGVHRDRAVRDGSREKDPTHASSGREESLHPRKAYMSSCIAEVIGNFSDGGGLFESFVRWPEPDYRAHSVLD